MIERKEDSEDRIGKVGVGMEVEVEGRQSAKQGEINGPIAIASEHAQRNLEEVRERGGAEANSRKVFVAVDPADQIARC